MGKRDDKYTLKGCIELDEGFFSTESVKHIKMIVITASYRTDFEHRTYRKAA